LLSLDIGSDNKFILRNKIEELFLLITKLRFKVIFTGKRDIKLILVRIFDILDNIIIGDFQLDSELFEFLVLGVFDHVNLSLLLVVVGLQFSDFILM
jgi:hypothetical protein